MKQYKVKITNKALEDMEAIYEYISDVLQAPDTAMKQYDRIADEIESLQVFPHCCAPVDPRLDMRQLLVDNYAAIYMVSEDTVTVIRVLYSASDIRTRLRESH